jgi:Anti-sigma-K factor rskA/Putative zinc-finger
MITTCDRVRELASGFVLGALEPDEMIAVSDHLDSCAKPHPEIEELGGVLAYMPETLDPIEPPAWLRESVISAAKADLATRRRAAPLPVAAAAVPPAEVAPAPAANVIPFGRSRISRRRRAMTWATRVAAAVAVVVLAGYALVLQGDLDRAKRSQAEDASLNYMLAQRDTLSAVLTSADGSAASGMAALRPTGHILVRAHGLAATQGDEIYAVWFSSGAAAPVKAGTFTVDDSGSGGLEVDNVPTSANLWVFVCREPNANVAKPTGPMIVSGTISL